jgi:hypothetical protein
MNGPSDSVAEGWGRTYERSARCVQIARPLRRAQHDRDPQPSRIRCRFHGLHPGLRHFVSTPIGERDHDGTLHLLAQLPHLPTALPRPPRFVEEEPRIQLVFRAHHIPVRGPQSPPTSKRDTNSFSRARASARARLVEATFFRGAGSLRSQPEGASARGKRGSTLSIALEVQASKPPVEPHRRLSMNSSK